MATAARDPHLGSGPDEDDVSLSESDSDSILSDDSVLPDYTPETSDKHVATTLYRACVRNDIVALRRVLERGVTKEEATELDINGWVRVSFKAVTVIRFSPKEITIVILLSRYL